MADGLLTPSDIAPLADIAAHDPDDRCRQAARAALDVLSAAVDRAPATPDPEAPAPAAAVALASTVRERLHLADGFPDRLHRPRRAAARGGPAAGHAGPVDAAARARGAGPAHRPAQAGRRRAPPPRGVAARLDELSDKPFLLLVHGTFSRGRSTFDGLVADPALFAELYRRYDGRVLVFDHPTLHVDPDANVSWLLDRLPDRAPLTVDVVCHSRGGLVGRQLSAKALAEAARRPVPVVRHLIHVATPNAGTVLAGRERWGTLLDVFTNMLSLFPDSPAGVALEGVLEVVKQVATGVLGGLAGLAAMDPDGGWLRGLDTGPPGAGRTVYAAASDWEPGAGASLAARALDLMVEPFFGAGNDLVVPTEGVYRGAGGYQAGEHLVVPTARGVTHSSFFTDTLVRSTLAGRLPGG